MNELNLQKLKHPERSERPEVRQMLQHLNQYHPISLAKEMGIPAVTMREILDGYEVPPKKLMEKLLAFDEKVRMAEVANNNRIV